VRVLVVRHGCAGDKRSWPGPDTERPLDDAGRRLAAALPGLLADRPIARIASSPTRRCVDTVVPLAEARGLAVAGDPGLAPSASDGRLLAAIVDPASAGAVLCTHGEVMAPALRRLRLAGVPIHARHDDAARLLAKGSVWELTVDAGRVTVLHHVEPAASLACPAHVAADAT
jgi:8-oxo-dGTP diphosphatase